MLIGVLDCVLNHSIEFMFSVRFRQGYGRCAVRNNEFCDADHHGDCSAIGWFHRAHRLVSEELLRCSYRVDIPRVAGSFVRCSENDQGHGIEPTDCVGSLAGPVRAGA